MSYTIEYRINGQRQSACDGEIYADRDEAEWVRQELISAGQADDNAIVVEVRLRHDRSRCMGASH